MTKPVTLEGLITASDVREAHKPTLSWDHLTTNYERLADALNALPALRALVEERDAAQRKYELLAAAVNEMADTHDEGCDRDGHSEECMTKEQQCFAELAVKERARAEKAEALVEQARQLITIMKNDVTQFPEAGMERFLTAAALLVQRAEPEKGAKQAEVKCDICGHRAFATVGDPCPMTTCTGTHQLFVPAAPPAERLRETNYHRTYTDEMSDRAGFCFWCGEAESAHGVGGKCSKKSVGVAERCGNYPEFDGGCNWPKGHDHNCGPGGPLTEPRAE